jgi:hypothetical protein
MRLPNVGTLGFIGFRDVFSADYAACTVTAQPSSLQKRAGPCLGSAIDNSVCRDFPRLRNDRPSVSRGENPLHDSVISLRRDRHGNCWRRFSFAPSRRWRFGMVRSAALGRPQRGRRGVGFPSPLLTAGAAHFTLYAITLAAALGPVSWRRRRASIPDRRRSAPRIVRGRWDQTPVASCVLGQRKLSYRGAVARS